MKQWSITIIPKTMVFNHGFLWWYMTINKSSKSFEKSASLLGK